MPTQHTNDISLTKMNPCGCKGARFCEICKHSDRVKGLKFAPVEISDDDRLHGFQQFLYCSQCQSAYPTNFPKISDFASIFAVAETFHDRHSAENLPELSLDRPFLVPDFLSEEEERILVQKIDSVDWVLSQSGRRKQDYGPKVNFKRQKVKLDSFVGMPEYSDMLLDRMAMISPEKLGSYSPFELCNLEYDPSRGSCIDFHTDDTWIWGPRLISINLISGSVMILMHEESKRLVLIPMTRRSLLCMDGDIRYQWKHGIFRSHISERRIALTMREPSHHFLPDGDLYETVGKQLLEIGSKRIASA